MKFFLWSGFIVLQFFLFLPLLTTQFPAMAASIRHLDFSILQYQCRAVPDHESRIPDGIAQILLWSADTPRNCWFDGTVEFRGNLLKCFLGVLLDKRISCSGIPSIAYYDRFILFESFRNQIDPALVKAVIWRESRFNHMALGSKGEVGLMQIMPGGKAAAADWAIAHSRRIPSEAELREPGLNVAVGTWYLARAMKHFRDCKDSLALALCEYNAGPGRAEDWIPDPDTPDESVFDLITIPSTRQYVKEILEKYESYKQEELQLKRNYL